MIKSKTLKGLHSPVLEYLVEMPRWASVAQRRQVPSPRSSRDDSKSRRSRSLDPRSPYSLARVEAQCQYSRLLYFCRSQIKEPCTISIIHRLLESRLTSLAQHPQLINRPQLLITYSVPSPSPVLVPATTARYMDNRYKDTTY